MRFLIYIEHAAENLQFYLWFLDYTTRFKALSANEQALSPEMAPFTYGSAEPTNNSNNNGPRASRVATKFFADAFTISNTRLAVPPPTKENPFGTPPRTPHSPASWRSSNYGLDGMNSGMIAPFLDQQERDLLDGNHAAVAAEAFQGVDMKWQPCKLFVLSISTIFVLFLFKSVVSISCFTHY